ncbi:MAG TPA: O-antigen ligase family protein [Bosea sp. (in: a-proteobacteria)]|uniref:O-antigen ligase family protein n=1 Tax=Bosea sp. (in: a-proteobacteria) TaxID=1871050 RepID=UPI002E1019D1|nr:O-antigen ligase family protein [Bosea sp. (in: a-proteobacteria)]
MAGDAGASAMGVGALVNVLVIAIALVLFLQAPLRAPWPVIAIWGPFLLIAFGATLYAPDFRAASRLAFILLTYWAFFAIPFFILRSSLDLSRFFLVVIGSSVPPTLYAFVDIARGLSDLDEFRLQSTFSHPNIYAFYLVLVLGLALYVRASHAIRVPPRIQILVTLYIPVLTTFLLLTKTRSAWVACGLMFLVYAFKIDRRFLAAFLLVPVLFIASPSLMERLTDVTAATEVDSFDQLSESTRLNSYVWRQALWEAAIPQILEQPLLGHGLESFRPSTSSFFPLIGPEGIDAHNLYLQTSFEMGLLGAVALAWLLGWPAYRFARALRRDPPGLLIILCILMTYLLESYSDNMHFYLSFNWYFWFVMGTVYAWICREEALAGPGATRRNELSRMAGPPGLR